MHEHELLTLVLKVKGEKSNWREKDQEGFNKAQEELQAMKKEKRKMRELAKQQKAKEKQWERTENDEDTLNVDDEESPFAVPTKSKAEQGSMLKKRTTPEEVSVEPPASKLAKTEDDTVENDSDAKEQGHAASTSSEQAGAAAAPARPGTAADQNGAGQDETTAEVVYLGGFDLLLSTDAEIFSYHDC